MKKIGPLILSFLLISIFAFSGSTAIIFSPPKVSLLTKKSMVPIQENAYFNKSNHKPELNNISFYTNEDAGPMILNEIEKAKVIVQLNTFLFGLSFGKQLVDLLEKKRKEQPLPAPCLPS